MLSTQTKSFFLLLLIAVGSSYVALVLTREILPVLSIAQTPLNSQQKINTKSEVLGESAEVKLDTIDWKTYSDSTYPLSFKYPKTWTATTYSAVDPTIGYIIVLNSDKANADHIRIYINKKSFLAMDGLPTTKITVNKIPAVGVSDNMLVGIKQANNFITFDLGASSILKPYFKAILNTVEITK